MNNLKNKKGSTSVLIIMLMVVLMMFGIAILTTTLSNRNLSTKKQEWVKDYYDLEAKVAVELADLDLALQEIKEKAIKSSDTESRTLVYKTLIEESIEFVVFEENHYLLEFSVEEIYGDYSKYIDLRIELPLLSNLDNDMFLKEENYYITLYSETQDLFDYEDIEFGVPFAPE